LNRHWDRSYNPLMRIAIGQINTNVGAFEQNRSRILTYVQEARSLQCDLVVFPELAVCGCAPLDSIWRPGYVAACAETLEAVRASSEGIGVVVGCITTGESRRGIDACSAAGLSDRRDLELFNTAVLIEDERVIGRAPKIHLSSQGVRHEHRYYSAGPGSEVFAFRGRTLGLSIQEDAWSLDGPTALQASLGADWIINVSASPFCLGKSAIVRRLIRDRAKENRVGIVHANLVGGQDGTVFDGGSFIVDAEGRLLFQSPRFAEGLFVCDLAEPHSVAPETPNDLVSLRSALTMGIRDYVTKNGFESVLIGLSGGIDSALVAALAVDALGSEHVACAYLPSSFSSEQSREDAEEIARRLSIELLEISIADIHQTMRNALPEVPTGLTDENLQPRIRATLWMALASQRRALVLCAGNKSEIAMGYSTLYGDTTGALAPIGDLYKTDVYRLAELFAEWIPRRVFDRPPTAELRPDQRDEDDLPPYSRLDALLRDLIEGNRSRTELISAGFEEALVDRVLTAYHRCEHKRSQLPPVLGVTSKPFGTGRRMPITHAYNG